MGRQQNHLMNQLVTIRFSNINKKMLPCWPFVAVKATIDGAWNRDRLQLLVHLRKQSRKNVKTLEFTNMPFCIFKLTLGSPIKAMPIESFLFWPPLSFPAGVFLLEVKSISFSAFSTSLFIKSSLTPWVKIFKKFYNLLIRPTSGWLFLLGF